MTQKNISNTVLLLLCMGTGGLYAQQSFNSSGGNATGSGGSAGYSVGQVAYAYRTGSSDASSEGVQQPYEIFSTGIDQLPGLTLAMTAYPNPAQATLHLKMESTVTGTLTCRLYDATGQLVLSQQVTGTLTEVPMQKLQAGTYLLKVADPQQVLKTFTIIKNN